MEENFRLYAKNLLLTYENCPEEWTKEIVKHKLVDQILVYPYGPTKYQTKVKAWLVAQKENNFKCLIELVTDVSIRNPKTLDILGIRGRYEPARNILLALQDVQQFGDWIGEGFPGMLSMNIK